MAKGVCDMETQDIERIHPFMRDIPTTGFTYWPLPGEFVTFKNFTEEELEKLSTQYDAALLRRISGKVGTVNRRTVFTAPCGPTQDMLIPTACQFAIETGDEAQIEEIISYLGTSELFYYSTWRETPIKGLSVPTRLGAPYYIPKRNTLVMRDIVTGCFITLGSNRIMEPEEVPTPWVPLAIPPVDENGIYKDRQK